MSGAEEMRELFVRWKESGVSLAAFGKQEGVAYAKLLYWRRKLGDDVARRKAPPRTVASVSLAPVQVVPDSRPIATHPERYEVWLTNGLSLDVAPGFDENELRRLVGVLLSC